MRLLKFVLIYILFGLSTLSYGDNSVQLLKFWNQITIKTPLSQSKKWLFLLETNNRFFNQISFYDQNVDRTWIGYQITDRASIWLGYDFAITKSISRRIFTYEHRPYPQLIWAIVKADKFILRIRSRPEAIKRIHQPCWAYRLRQQLSFTFPKLICGKYAFIIFDEIFINFNHPGWVTDNTVDQNRVFIGISIPILKNSNFLIGYMNQTKFRTVNEINHILYTAIKFNI